jgi:hypothetical protein
MYLFQFAFVPPQSNWLEQIARAAVPEQWGKDNSYLQTYCEANFEIAYDQNLIYTDPQERVAVWRVGHLTTAEGTPIYALFVKNRNENRQPYVLKTVKWSYNLVVNYSVDRDAPEEKIPVPSPPKEPNYKIPDYQQSYKIEYNWDHFLQEHKTRMEERLPGISERVLYLSIFGAVELSHRLYRLYAVPQYYKGRYQYLLPLYITHDNHSGRPDLIATLDEDADRHVYFVRTLLPPEWAYPNARAIATNMAQIRSWLE